MLPLPGDAGNVQYDSVSRLALVDIGERNEVAVIDPRRRRILREVPLIGCAHDHGLHLDPAHRLAFVACDENSKLLVLDLAAGRVIQKETVGERPDVLDFDPARQRLYVASESGVVSVFAERARRLDKLGQAMLAPHAQSAAADPRTGLVYFPIQDLGGRPVLRIMRPIGR